MAKIKYDFATFDTDGDLLRWLTYNPDVRLVLAMARGWDLPANEWRPTERDTSVVAWYYREVA